MTNPVATQIEAAAAPSLIAVLQAVQTFVANLGTDPARIPAKFPGALQVLVGSVELQLPALAVAELATLQGNANAKIASWISSLQKLGGAPSA